MAIFKSYVQVQGVHDQSLPPTNVGNSLLVNHDNTSQYAADVAAQLNTIRTPPAAKVAAIDAALAALGL